MKLRNYFVDRASLSAAVSTKDAAWSARGPLGALPSLSPAARRALAGTAILSATSATLVIAQGFLLADVLAGIVHGDFGPRTTQLAALLVIVVGRAALSWALRVVATRTAAGAKEELRSRAVDHALTLGPDWVSSRGTAEFTALSTTELDALDAYFTDYLPALVAAAILPLGIGVAILVADWPSAVIVAMTLPLLPLFAILVGKHTAARVAGATGAAQRLSGQLGELVRALPVLSAFRRASAQAQAVRTVSERHRRAALRTMRVAFSSAFVLELAATLSVALVAVVIGMRLVSGELSLAIGLGVLLVVPECYQPIRSLGAAFHASEDGLEAVRRVSAVLAEPVPDEGTRVPAPGEIRVNSLCVARRGGNAPDGDSFTAVSGATTWLSSPSGAGKTTTFAVLLGFVRPSAGTVTVSGIPMGEIDLSTWRYGLAWAPQSPVFTAASVRDELALALADRARGPNAAEMDAVLDDLGLAGTLTSQPGQLSVGQRQRLAVAKALLRVRAGAWLLLLDEPTAHLDEANTRRVHTAIRAAERAGAAVVIAAHTRASVLARVDDAGAQPWQGADEREAQPGPQAGLSMRSLLDTRLLAGAGLGGAALLAGIALTALSGWLIAKAAQQPPLLTLTVAIVGVRAAGLGRAGLRYVERLVTHDGAFRVAARLRVRLWQALVRRGPASTQPLRAGEGQRSLVADVDTIRDLLPRTITPPIVVTVVAAAAIGLQTALLPGAGAVLALCVVAGALLAPLLTVRLERRATSTLAAGRRAVAANVFDLVEGLAELVACGGHRLRRDQLAAADRRLAGQSARQAFGAGAGDALLILVTGIAAVGATVLAASAVAAGRLDPTLAPVLALVPLALAEVLAALPPAARHGDALRAARGRLAELDAAPDPPRIAATGEGIHLHGDLRWPGAAEPVLCGAHLDIPAASKVAVTGSSGGGKSTLLAGMLGFLAPERGSAALPDRIAWAPQEPELVATTVGENVRLAEPGATEDDIRDVLSRMRLDAVDPGTRLGSGGAGLSAGQAQRVGLARALIAKESADLTVLDEPTSHLDERTAAAVLAELNQALAGHTVVYVTHRRAELADVDVIIEVAAGTAIVTSATIPVLAG